MFDPSQSSSPSDAGPADALQRGLRLLTEAAAAFDAVNPTDLPEATLSEALRVWDHCQNRLDAARVETAAVWDARLTWSADGARSGASWLASHTHQARPAAGALLKLGRSLLTMPLTAEAFSSGQLGIAKARLLAAAAKSSAACFTRDESMLVDQAKRLRVDQLQRALGFWQTLANPDGAQDRQARQHDARHVSISQTIDGMWRLDGQLTPEDGEILATELNRLAQARYRAERAEADANCVLVTSTAAQRRADALVDLARQGVANPDGTANNVPAITALIDVTKLIHPDTMHGDVVGESEHGMPITAEVARRLTCDCHVSRIVTGSDSVPIDLGKTARLPSPAQRRALASRDRGCTFPGCDRPPGWSAAHHLVHWIDDGPTDLANMTLLCNFHHHRVHEGGFGVVRQPDGHLRFTRPDGSELTVPHGNAPPAEQSWPNVA